MIQRAHCSILVVDDDDAHRYAVARSLRAAGFKTMEASSGAQALEFAEYVSAVVLDVHLPDLLGWEVCRLLRARLSTANLPVIHISARHITAADRHESEQCGAQALLVTPVAPADLIAAVDGVLDREQRGGSGH